MVTQASAPKQHSQPSGTTIEEWLAPFQPKLDTDELVVEVNRAFHDFEARDYDARHPEVHAQLPPIWRDMIRQANELRPGSRWRILDFGCGTGFEAAQLLENLAPGSVDELVCYDLSEGMLERCRERVRDTFPRVQCHSAINELVPLAPFNLLATNSLLHHLPDISATLKVLEPLFLPDAVWLAGHEPSARFYRNPTCLSTYERFRNDRHGRIDDTWLSGVSATRWRRRIARFFGRLRSPKKQTARHAFERGWFAVEPPSWLIDRLVDRHVAHSLEEVTAGRGLDFTELEQQLSGRWKLKWRKTYSFMGAVYEGRLAPAWRETAGQLAKQFPDDGANFSTVWQRC